jgi:hypothetical protein
MTDSGRLNKKRKINTEAAAHNIDSFETSIQGLIKTTNDVIGRLTYDGTPFHHRDLVIEARTRMQPNFAQRLNERRRQHWLEKRTTTELVLLRVKEEIDEPLIFDALVGFLPRGVHICKFLKKKLKVNDLDVIAVLTAQGQAYAQLDLALKLNADVPLPSFSSNYALLVDAMEQHLRRLSKHDQDDSFARLMCPDVLCVVVSYLIDLPKRIALDCARSLARVSRMWRSAMQRFISHELPTLQLEHRFRSLFKGGFQNRGDILRQIPQLKPYQDYLPITYYKTTRGWGHIVSLREISQSFTQIFGSSAVTVLNDIHLRQTKFEKQREQWASREAALRQETRNECEVQETIARNERAARAQFLMQELPLHNVTFDANNRKVHEYCQGLFNDVHRVVQSLRDTASRITDVQRLGSIIK